MLLKILFNFLYLYFYNEYHFFDCIFNLNIYQKNKDLKIGISSNLNFPSILIYNSFIKSEIFYKFSIIIFDN